MERVTDPLFFLSAFRIRGLTMAIDRESERLDKYVCSVTSFTRSVLGKEIRKRGASLNGKQVKDPSVKVTDGDVIGIAGMEITVSLKPVYLMMNKPVGVVSANSDDSFDTVFSLLPECYARCHCVGRLDIDTEGLLLITDDGQWSHRITSPAKGVRKVYRAVLAEELSDEAIARIRNGIELRGEKEPAFAEVTKVAQLTYDFAVTEGRYHEIKRIAAAAGSRVEELRRLSIGALSLDETLEPGMYRALCDDEVLLPLANAASDEDGGRS